MGADKETREKLIDSARKEFMEKGYNKASLRKICADAGVTTLRIRKLCLVQSLTDLIMS